MNQIHFTTNKEKYEHFTEKDLRHIQSEYNFFLATSKKRRPPKTEFMHRLAKQVNTSVSNLYKVMKKGLVAVMNSNLTQRIEFSCDAILNHQRTEFSNSLKIHKAFAFIDLVINEFRKNPLSSVDEIIHDFILNRKDKIEGMTTICTKSFYNYINDGWIDLKPIDLPMMVKRKKRSQKRIPSSPKGTSIDQRPALVNDREEFGHWEGDLIVGGKTKDHGALLTLIERKTRFSLSIQLKNKTSKQVYMAFNRIEKQYGEFFPVIFKTITFDNGNEFARYKDIEKKPHAKNTRTKVYFAHPYSAWERGTNENCNRLYRYFVKKGVNILQYSKSYIENVTKLINQKVRKVLGYQTANRLFIKELSSILSIS